MRGNDLLPGALYRGPLDEFQAYDALPRSVRRALAAARFQWSAAHCVELLARGETVSGIIDLIRHADVMASRQVPRRGLAERSPRELELRVIPAGSGHESAPLLIRDVAAAHGRLRNLPWLLPSLAILSRNSNLVR